MMHKPLTALLLATLTLLAKAQDLPAAEAEVRRVDTGAGKVTLKHGEIRNLDMPPMTMVFRVKEPGLLTGIKPGDRVRFTADKVGGDYTVLSLEPLKP